MRPLRTPTVLVVLASLVLALAPRCLVADEEPAPDKARRRFQAVDRDGDGRLSPAELPYPRLFARLDTDGDGSLSFEEARDALERARAPNRRGGEPPAPPWPDLVRHLDIPYAEIEGVDPKLLSLDLYAPEHAGRQPVMVMIHGGGWRNGDKASAGMTTTKVPFFVGRGYVYVSVNYRLSSTPDVKHPMHVQDVAAALAWVHDHVAEYGGDPDRIFLMGHSAGAHLAALVAIDSRRLAAHGKPLSILKGVVCLDTAAYDVPRYVNELGAGPVLRRMYEAAFGATEAAWRDASPRHHVAPGQGIPPMLFFHTGRRLAGEQLSNELVAALGDAGVEARAVHAADRDHAGINACIGQPGDPYTRMVLDLLEGEPSSGSDGDAPAPVPAPQPAPSAEETGRRPPNVLLIVSDDQGWAEAGCQGIQDVLTPNIDRIASAGVRFTNGYVTASVCSPSRAGLLTGRYPQRFGHEHNPGTTAPNVAARGLPLDERTMADHLGAAGYATGVVGKWHLGMTDALHPLSRGFDEFFGFLHGGHAYFPTDGRGAQRNPILRGRDVVEEPAYLTDAFAREAVDFVSRHHEEPFFLYLAFNAVHAPLQATPEDEARFAHVEDRRRRTYLAMQWAMDRAIGRVVNEVERHGLLKDTLIVFLSDNGGPTRKTTSSNLPLRGGKGTLYEGGIRVPYLLRWDGHVPAGQVVDHPVSALDVLPTALGAARRPAAKELALDGVDLLPLLTGETQEAPHAVLFWRMGRSWAVRYGDLKLVVDARSRSTALYDLARDVSETRDLASERPDVVRGLQALYLAWEEGTIDALWPGGSRPARRGAR